MPIPVILSALAAPVIKAAAGAAATKIGSKAGGKILSKLLSNKNVGGAGAKTEAGGVGTNILQNISNTKGSMLGAGIGTIQSIKAAKAKKEAEALMPPASDPTQLAFLAEMNQKRRALNTGSQFAANMGYLRQAAAGTNQAIVQAGGGDVAGTMQALLGSQANVGRAMNDVLAASDEQQKFYNTFASDLTNKIAQRRMELALSKSLQKRAEWAQGSQDAFANISNAAARGMGVSDWANILKRNPSSMTTNAATPPPQPPLAPAPGISDEIPGAPAPGVIPAEPMDI